MTEINDASESSASRPSLIVRIPTPVWFAILLIASLLAARLTAAPDLLRHLPTGVAFIAFGIGLAIWAQTAFRRARAEIMPWSDTHSALVVDGPFRFTRNPMYVGVIAVSIGVALVTGSWLTWLVPIILFVLDNFVIIPYEERSMQRAFGDEFLAYRQRVRRWL